ncbi:MAG: CoA transferase [Spongiibacteraceae bacterium]
MPSLSGIGAAAKRSTGNQPLFVASDCQPTPSVYARHLLDSLGLHSHTPRVDDDRDPSLLWAQSGAMWLSGHTGEPARACPAPLAACAQGVWLALSALCPSSIDPHFDAYKLLGERAAIAGLTRQGHISAGGACTLLKTSDGMLALNLVRKDDFDLLPAWLEQELNDKDDLAVPVRTRTTAVLLERARLLGLAVALVIAPQPSAGWYKSCTYAPVQSPRKTVPLVVDLSSLWAGPLCGQLLSQCGARVIKVESNQRNDGARAGPEAFYHLMNAGKESVSLDLKSPLGVAQLRSLIEQADIVIESARPRGLEQMGIVARDILEAHPGKTWLSITGYGRSDPMRDWIAYGDDAGVAAGLSWLMGGDKGDPVFCGDAIADPLTGLHGALLAQAGWQNGGGQLLELTLHGVVAHCIAAGAIEPSTAKITPSPPVARIASVKAAALGADTARILKEFVS